MKQNIIVICPCCEQEYKTERLQKVLRHMLEGFCCEWITEAAAFRPLRDQKVLFAISLGESGVNLEYYRLLKRLRTETDCLEGCVGSVIVDGESELFTKAVARDIVFAANRCGCAFPGRAMVEGTGSLQNFRIQAMRTQTDYMGAYVAAACDMMQRLRDYAPIRKEEPKLLVLHAGSHQTSNTLSLWEMVKSHLDGCKIREISLRNGEIQDCSGCPYTMCMHYSKKASCYYGGVIVEQVYPAILDCDALVMLCPNYNDAISANLSAFVNRLTSLFRQTAFYDKTLFGIVVSGYSGGDLVAGQLISGLHMNKTFRLPPHFAMLETANDPGSIYQVEGIAQRAAAFAEQILVQIRKD